MPRGCAVPPAETRCSESASHFKYEETLTLPAARPDSYAQYTAPMGQHCAKSSKAAAGACLESNPEFEAGAHCAALDCIRPALRGKKDCPAQCCARAVEIDS